MFIATSKSRCFLGFDMYVVDAKTGELLGELSARPGRIY
jgi:hypothetical protein